MAGLQDARDDEYHTHGDEEAGGPALHPVELALSFLRIRERLHEGRLGG
jgi:hypothetical protein